MKLTRRQEEFVHKMIELRQEFNGPVHYSLLARRLGVSPFTAYDMLCLLEEKGYVTSEYQLSTEKSGPGRAERVFYPGEKAHAHVTGFFGEVARDDSPAEGVGGASTGSLHLEGQALQEYVLQKLHQGGIPEDERELAGQLMARMMLVGQGDVDYCVEVMTIAALRLQGSAGWQTLAKHLPTILPCEGNVCPLDLCMLGGFIFGLLAQECIPGQEWLVQMREHLQGYLDAVSHMDSQDCSRLAGQLAHMFAALGGDR